MRSTRKNRRDSKAIPLLPEAFRSHSLDEPSQLRERFLRDERDHALLAYDLKDLSRPYAHVFANVLRNDNLKLRRDNGPGHGGHLLPRIVLQFRLRLKL